MTTEQRARANGPGLPADPVEAWAEARDMAALALDALDGPQTPEALDEAQRYISRASLVLQFPAWHAVWSHHMANLPTGQEYFGEAL